MFVLVKMGIMMSILKQILSLDWNIEVTQIFRTYCIQYTRFPWEISSFYKTKFEAERTQDIEPSKRGHLKCGQHKIEAREGLLKPLKFVEDQGLLVLKCSKTKE